MSNNSNMHHAKAVKNDEFYTQPQDVLSEMDGYYDYDNDAFRGKVVLCPCDDHRWSAFARVFMENFDKFGLKRLICSSYEKDGHGKLLVYDGESNVSELEGNGDFRSDEVKALRDQADLVITNPPFSLAREFVDWLFEKPGLKFAFIGNLNMATCKNVWPHIFRGEMWPGCTTPKEFFLPNGHHTGPSHNVQKFGNIWWFTNLDYKQRHQSATNFNTMEENLLMAKSKIAKTGKENNLFDYANNAYWKYDNYDAIEVPKWDFVPSDYDGVMGVPISALPKICHEQFEIVGVSESEGTGFSNGLHQGDTDKHALITKVKKKVFKQAERCFIRLFIKARTHQE